MTTLKERITAEMKDAMRAKEAVRLDAIRLLRAAIQRREVDERTELGEEEVLAVVQKMIKQGRDAIEQFEKGGRDDLVQKEPLRSRCSKPTCLSNSMMTNLLH